MKELTQIPFHDTTTDGTYVALRPVCEALGLDVHSQRPRLQRQSWAVEVIMTSTGADGKTYEMTFIDRRTFTMWLATIDTGRVKNEHTRELIRTYQCEAADALDKYFNEGAAINPRAVEVPTPSAEDKALNQAARLADLIGKFRGIIADDYLDAKAKIVLARAMGDTPEIEASARPLYLQDYMREQGASSKEISRATPPPSGSTSRRPIRPSGVSSPASASTRPPLVRSARCTPTPRPTGRSSTALGGGATRTASRRKRRKPRRIRRRSDGPSPGLVLRRTHHSHLP